MTNKRMLLIDTNMGLDHVLTIAKDEKKPPYYAVAGISAYPVIEESISGYGMVELVKENDWSGIIKECDTVIFLDSGYGSLVDSTRAAGYNVFGAPESCESLEFDRIYFRKIAKELGIETNKAEIVHGVDAVLEFLDKHEGETFYIKLNRYRGNIETFRADSSFGAKILLNQAFPAMGSEMDFIIEYEAKNCIEIGADAWFNGKRFLKKHFFTVEKKGCGNMGIFVEHSVLDDFMAKITPFLAKNNYHGAFCFEGFWDGEVFRASDITPRIPYPCSASWTLAIKDYAKFFRGIASGEIDDFEILYPYQIQMAAFAEDPTVTREVVINEKELDGKTQKIAFRKAVKIKDNKGKEHYVYIPKDDLMAACLGAGNGWEEGMKAADECTDKISGYKTSVETGVQLYFKTTLENLKKYGIELTPATNKKEKAELDVRGKLEEIEAKIVHVVRENKPDLTLDIDPKAQSMQPIASEYCSCEEPEPLKDVMTKDGCGVCAKCSKHIKAEITNTHTNPMKDITIPHPKETETTIQ
jgi:hypothetical protein